MIIKSYLSRSSVYRRTRISDPLTTTFDFVIETLLSQWNLSTSNNAIQASDYALLIAVEANTEQKLVVDKQVEWQLFCEEHVSLQQETVIELEIVTRSSLADRSR